MWKTKLNEREKECDFMDEWRRRNNILIFGIEEYPHKTCIKNNRGYS